MADLDDSLPPSKRRRIDDETGEEGARVDEQQEEVIPDSDGEQEMEIPLPSEHKLVHTTDTSDDGQADESMLLHEADKSLPHAGEDEWDAVYDELEWDGLLAADADNAAQQIFSPSQRLPQATSHHPSSSPLKAHATNVDGDARAEVAQQDLEDTTTFTSQQQQHPMSSQEEEEEARIREQEAAMLAKYRNLDYLTKFNAQHAAFDSPVPGGNVSFASAGFTSVRGKKLIPSEEALAKASRFAQFSPEAAKDGEGQAGSTIQAMSTETPTFQRSRSARQLPMQSISGAPTPGVPSAVSNVPNNAETNPLQPLRYGPKKGHTLLPNRLPGAPPRQIETPTKEHRVPCDSFAGFTSGSGARVAMPSKEEAEKHVKELERRDEDSRMQEEVDGIPSSSPPEVYPGLSFAGGAAFKMPSKALLAQEAEKMQIDVALPSESVTNETTVVSKQIEQPVQAFSGLLSASGKAVAMPSKERIAKVVNNLDSTEGNEITATNMAVTGGFTTGGGKTVPVPSEEQIRAATSMLDRSEGDVTPAKRASTPFAGLTSGGGKVVAGPTAQAIAASTSRLDKADTTTTEDRGKVVSTPARPALASKGTNFLPRSTTPGLGAQSVSRGSTPIPALNKPFRVPVVNHLNAPSTPGRPGNSQSILASQPRRLNLEMTPRNTPKSALNRSTFKTPFKNGLRPDPRLLETLKQKSNSKMITPGKSVDVVVPSQSSGTATKAVAGSAGKSDYKIVKNSVFDLYTKVPRKSMAEYGLDPYISIGHLIDCKIPTDVIFMTYPKAEAYKFRGEFGFEAAFEDLVYYCDCSNITIDWVRNHWTLIVWKTAAMIRAKPDECVNWWNFQRMVDQLKYRYEKEVVCGQRSCIKRIQERDSSAWLPMILLVTEIIYEERDIPPEPGSEEERQGIVRREMVAVAMVLSDGWYKIRTSGLDDSLFRGIAFRSIYPGLKIRIQGAKLDGGSDGAEPLEAFASSTIVISGNSTSRAAWHEKLGFQKRPYICAFSSLLPDGGIVPFIDVIITRLYPLGYKGPYVEGESPDLWDEEEERVRQRKWESDRANALEDVQTSLQTAFSKLAQLQCLITTTLHIPSKKTEGIKDEDPSMSDFSDVYDKLEEEPDKAPLIVRRLSKDVLEDLAAFVKRKMENFTADGGQGMDKEIESRCPPRVAKAFRIVRVKDARVSQANANRDCQLNVNDVLNLGADYLVEGKRYLISNVNPGRPTAWSAPKAINGEIFLSTRFDSRWQVLPL